MSGFGRKRIFLRLMARLIAVALLLQSANVALALDRRIAFVLGNADYETAPRLDNSVRDAKAVRDALSRIGFEIYFGANLKRIETEELLKRFYRAADGASVSLFYYAGHGLQLAGSNYVVPIDANLTAVSDIQLQAMNVDDIFQYLRLHTSAQLIFLDACRTNPAAGQKYWVVDSLRTADQDQGLARSAPSVGSLIAYATEPGKVAFDGNGPNSPYTSALVHHVSTPNQEIREMLTRVRRDVMAATDGRQVPWETSSLVDDVYLVHAPPPPVAEPFTQVRIPKADQPEPLSVPPPRAGSDAALSIAIEGLPDKGRLFVSGKLLTGPVRLNLDEFRTLAFDPSGLGEGAMGIVSYSALDPYGQMARGVVVITVVASSGETRPADTEARARTKLLEEARHYVTGLEGAQRSAEVGVGPAPIGLMAFSSPKGSGIDVSLARVPDNGLLWLNDRVLTPGVRIALADVRGIAFEPKIGSDVEHPGVFALALVADDSAQAQVLVKPVLDPCDLEAAAPFDLQGVAPGKLPNEIDAPKAIAACQQATVAHPDVARFRYQLGRAYLAAGDVAKAKRALNDAAERKHLRATASLADLEQFGVVGPANPEKAAALYASCSASGDVYCMQAYGKAKYYGNGVAKDSRGGLELMIRAAELGHTYAMNELGYIFTYGKGLPADLQRGVAYYESGAARNDIYSLNNLGLVYWRGAGRPIDLARARDLFVKAAEGGHPYAPTNLGEMYRDGVGVERDTLKAKTWAEVGAQRGDYWGALDRGRIALGEPAQNVEAAKWLALAVALNVNRGNNDPEGTAAKLLAGLPQADKQAALAELEREVGDAPLKSPQHAQLDAQLAAISDQLWRRTKPRFDLF
jgi:TPR repeat protein